MVLEFTLLFKGIIKEALMHETEMLRAVANISTVIPRLTKIIPSGITFISRNFSLS